MPEIDWEADFPEVMRQWKAAQEFSSNAKAAEALGVPVESWNAWLYRKNGVRRPDFLIERMQKISEKSKK